VGHFEFVDLNIAQHVFPQPDQSESTVTSSQQNLTRLATHSVGSLDPQITAGSRKSEHLAVGSLNAAWIFVLSSNLAAQTSCVGVVVVAGSSVVVAAVVARPEQGCLQVTGQMVLKSWRSHVVGSAAWALQMAASRSLHNTSVVVSGAGLVVVVKIPPGVVVVKPVETLFLVVVGTGRGLVVAVSPQKVMPVSQPPATKSGQQSLKLVQLAEHEQVFP